MLNKIVSITLLFILWLPSSLVAESKCSFSPKEGNIHCAASVSVAFDLKGTLWAVWIQSGTLYVSHSLDQGESFQPPVNVNRNTEDISLNPENRPSIAFGPQGEVYVVWNSKLEKRFSGNVKFSQSSDGIKFSAPIIINDDRREIGHGFARMQVDKQGRIYIFWLDAREKVNAKKQDLPYNGTTLYYAISNDGGLTFPNKKLNDSSCECCRIASTLTREGNPVIAWRKLFTGGYRDHAAIRFNNDSVFTKPFRLEDQWSVDACPHHGPTLAVDDEDNQHIVWFTGAKQKVGLHYSKVDSELLVQSQLKKIGGVRASHPSIITNKNTIMIAWKEFDGHNTLLKLITSSDKGKSWNIPITASKTSGASDHPYLIQYNGKALLSWHRKNEGYTIQNVGIINDSTIGVFKLGSFKEIVNNSLGKKVLFSLWSIDCPPCRDELKLLSNYQQKHPQASLVLVSTDDIQLKTEVENILSQYDLSGIELLQFSGSSIERLRYEIDPNWSGVLPRSYFITDGVTSPGRNGTLTEELLDTFL
ncbi:MAG: hypothetical protein JKY24_06835 [Pseudomonadales bacterium]|nr:hypothetical protein [Pseudomonadales bacterium]